jgi:hypothetical protein
VSGYPFEYSLKPYIPKYSIISVSMNVSVQHTHNLFLFGSGGVRPSSNPNQFISKAPVFSSGLLDEFEDNKVKVAT